MRTRFARGKPPFLFINPDSWWLELIRGLFVLICLGLSWFVLDFRPVRGQPHFRHTFPPLPAPHASWRACRLALCSDAQPGTPPCEACKEAVAKLGDDPQFQTVGRRTRSHGKNESWTQHRLITPSDLLSPEIMQAWQRTRSVQAQSLREYQQSLNQHSHLDIKEARSSTVVQCYLCL